MSPAVVVPAAVEHDGVNHRYLDSMSGLRSPGEVLGAPAHDAGSPVLVRWGFGSGGTFTLDPGGRGAPMSGRTNRGGGSSSHLVQSGDTSQVTLTGVRLAGKRTRLWIALYKPIR